MFGSWAEARLSAAVDQAAVTDVSKGFDLSFTTICIQAFLMLVYSLLNFISHFVYPPLLQYAHVIKNLSKANFIVVGAFCLCVMLTTRFNEAASACSGDHLTEAERGLLHGLEQSPYLLRRGEFLRYYISVVLSITLSCTFVFAIMLVLYVRKMGFG